MILVTIVFIESKNENERKLYSGSVIDIGDLYC